MLTGKRWNVQCFDAQRIVYERVQFITQLLYDFVTPRRLAGDFFRNRWRD
jgi:hypothetical protein